MAGGEWISESLPFPRVSVHNTATGVWTRILWRRRPAREPQHPAVSSYLRYSNLDLRGAYDKFPDIFRMATFIDSTHMKL